MNPLKAVSLVSAVFASALAVTYNQQSRRNPGYSVSSDNRSTVNITMERYLEEEKHSAPDTVDNNEEFSKPLFVRGRFKNPWESWTHPKLMDVMRVFLFTKSDANVPSQEELDKTLPIIKPDVQEFDKPLPSGVRMMWVGHATVVVQLDGLTIMTDPVFSQRAGPMQYTGSKRYRDPACSVQELPKIDAVVISHNHYDHLDHGSVVDLNRRFGKDLKWFVPMGLKKWMNNTGCEDVVEMTWWDEQDIGGNKGIRVACTPCQHWCRRSVFDTDKVLWCSWCILGPKHSFHFSGDSGYCPAFKQIGRKYGPFTTAAIPIGAYHPRWFMSPQHVDPAQAVQVHTDVKSKHSVGIHWGTFNLSLEHYLEPRELLQSEVKKRGLSPEAFVTVKLGEITTFAASDV